MRWLALALPFVANVAHADLPPVDPDPDALPVPGVAIAILLVCGALVAVAWKLRRTS